MIELERIDQTKLELLNYILFSIYETKHEIIAQNSLLLMTDSSRTFVKVGSAAKKKKMSLQDFLLNFYELYKQQMIGYPDNVIQNISFRSKVLYVDYSINIADFIENYVIVDDIYLQHNINFALCADLQQYNNTADNGCALMKLGFILYAGSFVFLVLSAYFGFGSMQNSPLSRVFGIISLAIGSISSIICLFSYRYYSRAKEIVKDDALKSQYADCCYRLCSMILHLVSRNTLIKALEQAVIVEYILADDVPLDIINCIILYAMGDAKGTVDTVFSAEESLILTNYLQQKHFATEEQVVPIANNQQLIKKLSRYQKLAVRIDP